MASGIVAVTPLRVALLALDPAAARVLARELRRQPARRRVLVAVAPGAVVWACAAWLAKSTRAALGFTRRGVY